MNRDPVIQEIREIRHRISEECGHDAKRLVEKYRKQQSRFAERLWRGRRSAQSAAGDSDE